MLKKFLAALALAGLTACASVPNPLSVDQRGGVFVEDVSLNWKVDESKREPTPQYVEGKTDMQTRLEAAVEQEFRASPSGSTPVNFVVDVKTYNRVGAAMGNLIGGSNMVVADVRVVRKSDGAQLGVYENVTGMHASNGGVIGLVAQAVTKPDVVGIMANSFATNLRKRFESK
jgi:SepF-like predicted cell division protein (DUF552 family)